MKKIILLSLLTVLFVSCRTQSNIVRDSSETLITHQCKVAKQGYFLFLKKEGPSFKVLTYYYFINKKTNTVSCRAFPEKIVEANQLENYHWKTSEGFMSSATKIWREKCFNYFSEDFVDISNDEKLTLLDELSKQERPTVPPK